MNENSGLKTYFEINISQFFKISFFFTYFGDKTVEEYSRERKGWLKGISIRWRKSFIVMLCLTINPLHQYQAFLMRGNLRVSNNERRQKKINSIIVMTRVIALPKTISLYLRNNKTLLTIYA